MSSEFTDEELYQQLFDLQEEKEHYQSQIELARHECDDYLELRIRHFGGGSHYVKQCMKCGRQKGQTLKRDAALAENGGSEPPPFDSTIEIDRDQAMRQISLRISSIYDEERQISALINGWSLSESETFFDKERKALEQANKKLAELLVQFEKEFGEDKVINSLVQQTVQRKKKRYIERLEKTDRFNDEYQVKNWLKDHFERDFHIYEEVWGVHLAENVNVRIDFVFYPKPHLIEAGFVEEPFGVEAKYFKQEDGFTRKTSRGIWQTISYNDCQFEIGARKFRLKFCLLFSNLSFTAETALIRNLGYEGENDQVEWSGMLHVANHARVGVLSVSGSREMLKGWAMRFAGGTYFSSSLYNGEARYNLSDSNIINKVRVGNF